MNSVAKATLFYKFHQNRWRDGVTLCVSVTECSLGRDWIKLIYMWFSSNKLILTIVMSYCHELLLTIAISYCLELGVPATSILGHLPRKMLNHGKKANFKVNFEFFSGFCTLTFFKIWFLFLDSAMHHIFVNSLRILGPLCLALLGLEWIGSSSSTFDSHASHNFYRSSGF